MNSMPSELRNAIVAIDGVVESESMFKDDLAFWVNGKEIAHFESERVLDIRLTRQTVREHRAELRAEQAVRLRSSTSDWITVELDQCDPELAVRLVRLAAEAHQPDAGRIPSPPPTGPDLVKRKRFH